MMKHLTIRYGDTVLFDAVPGQVTWSEAANGAIRIEAGPMRQSGFLEQLQAASRRQTEAKRAELVNGGEQPRDES